MIRYADPVTVAVIITRVMLEEADATLAFAQAEFDAQDCAREEAFTMNDAVPSWLQLGWQLASDALVAAEDAQTAIEKRYHALLVM